MSRRFKKKKLKKKKLQHYFKNSELKSLELLEEPKKIKEPKELSQPKEIENPEILELETFPSYLKNDLIKILFISFLFIVILMLLFFAYTYIPTIQNWFQKIKI